MCGMEELEENEIVATENYILEIDHEAVVERLQKENKELKENILDIVDQCFHAYASSSRGEAVEYAQELMDESE